MIGQDTHEVERKVVTILKILSDSPEPIGSRAIAARLKDCGVCLSERAVRYHLQFLDERGLTRNVSKKDGRLITPSGVNELHNAMVSDRMGSAMSRIKTLVYQISFDAEKRTGKVPVNVSLFPADKFNRALGLMKNASGSNICFSDLVAVAGEGERLGNIVVPEGEKGLATLSGIFISGALIKSGIPLDFKFAGLLQLRNRECMRFVDLISYTGTSLDPSEIFIAGKMTSVSSIVREGNGKMIASFCEIPALAVPGAETVFRQLETAGITGLCKTGGSGEKVCGIQVGMNRVGIILSDGLNMVALAAEAGIEMKNYAMSSVIEFNNLVNLQDL